MKRIFSVLLASACLTLGMLPACATPRLSSSVTLCRYALYNADLKGETVEAYLERAENPFSLDGVVNPASTKLVIILPYEGEPVRITAEIPLKNTTVTGEFTYDAVFDRLLLAVPAENFPTSGFTARLLSGGETVELTFRSVVPQSTATEEEILTAFYEKQKTFVDERTENGALRGEIHLKLLVINEKVYWYLCYANESEKRAMLFDAMTKEILALKDVF